MPPDAPLQQDPESEGRPQARLAGLAAHVGTALQGSDGVFDLDVQLAVPPGQILAITGPSGAGKTSLLRCIAGLVTPVRGRVCFDDTCWFDSVQAIHVPVRDRSIGFVFQDYGLFPNMTARGNIRFALSAIPRSERRAEADRLLASVGLLTLADQRPAKLSGGQRQRLALVRALARRPRLLMLDEPLSALDAETREAMRQMLLAVVGRELLCVLMVSHDADDVQRLADRVVRIERGRVV